jgi:hypothetical protein
VDRERAAAITWGSLVDLDGLTLCGQLRLRRALGVVALALACTAERDDGRSRAGAGVRTTATPEVPTADVGKPLDLGALRRPAPERLVAVGDLHGDLEATRRAFRLAAVIDDRDRWIGGKTVVVQTGDQLDRGDDERAILDFLERIAREAEATGGAVIALNGNHEVMNVLGDFRYVTEGGFRDFADGAGADLAQARLAELPEHMRGRGAAFAPGGPIAQRLAARSIAAVVGSTAFAHGGILPEHVGGLRRLDADVQKWMMGDEASEKTVAAIMDPQSPVWTRVYADDGDDVCRRLQLALVAMGAARMVVGHTVQKQGITSACDGRLWRIDVGLAAHYGGRPQVLEIVGDEVRVLS